MTVFEFLLSTIWLWCKQQVRMALMGTRIVQQPSRAKLPRESYGHNRKWELGLSLERALEEPYEAEAPRTVLKPSSSNGA